MNRINQLLSRYRTLSPSIKSSFWFVVCNIIQKTVVILTTPIYTRLMNTEQYGEYTTFLTWVELGVILTSLDIFYSGYNVGMERFRNDRSNYTSSMHGLCLLLTSVWVIILFPLASTIGPFIKLPVIQFKLLLGYMYIFPIFQFWSARKKYEYDYKPLIIVTSIISICTIMLGTILTCCFTVKSTGAILGKIIVEAALSIPLLVVSVNGIRSLFNSFYWKYALKFNIPLIPHYLSTMILNHSDRLMIVFICGKSDAGIYGVAYFVAMLMTIVQTAINSAIVPYLYGKLHKEEHDGLARTITLFCVFTASINIILLIVAPEMIKLISTEEYYEAVRVIPPITFGVFLTSVYGMFANIEFYFHYNRFAAMASVASAVSNIILNYIFINKYGYIAAGYTTFASYLLLTIMHFIGLNRVLRIHKINISDIVNNKTIIVIVLLFFITTVLIYSLYNVPYIRYGLLIPVFVWLYVKRSMIRRFVNSIRAGRTD